MVAAGRGKKLGELGDGAEALLHIKDSVLAWQRPEVMVNLEGR